MNEENLAEQPVNILGWQNGSRPGLDYCVTCSDEGRQGVIIRIPDDFAAPALVRTEEGEEEVDITLTPEATLGSTILIHAGSALTVVN